MLQVGSLGVRWVLMKHAEPWLLTVNSRQWSQSRFSSNRLPFLENQHNIPFMRKRSSREVQQETEEPPAKKSDVHRREGEDVEGSSSDITSEKPNEEEQLEAQKERADEGSGEKLLNMEEEEGKQMQPQEEGEEEAGKKKVEGEERLEKKKELRAREDSIDDERDEEASSSPTGPAGVDYE